MSTSVSLLVILVSSVALVKGVKLFINSVSKLAHKFKISGYTISFFLVAVGTSMPEAVVAIRSAAQQNSLLAFGNSMGSNIALVTFVIAIPALWGVGISTRTVLNSRDIYYTAIFSLLPIILVTDGILSRYDGVILLMGYAVYSWAVLKRAGGIENILYTLNNVNISKELGAFMMGIVILLGASELIVRAAVSLSYNLNLGLGFIGLTITAIGTSLPEIAFTIAAIKELRQDEILGDIVGSVVANATLVLGAAAVIYPINLLASPIGVPTLFFLIFTLLLFLHFARTKERLDFFEGTVLLILYALFVTTEYIVAKGLVQVF